MKPITLLLVDDHAVMRMGLASLLETCRDVKVVGDTGDGESAVRMALRSSATPATAKARSAWRSGCGRTSSSWTW